MEKIIYKQNTSLILCVGTTREIDNIYRHLYKHKYIMQYVFMICKSKKFIIFVSFTFNWKSTSPGSTIQYPRV